MLNLSLSLPFPLSVCVSVCVCVHPAHIHLYYTMQQYFLSSDAGGKPKFLGIFHSKSEIQKHFL